MFARQILKSRGRPTAGLSSLACAGFFIIFLMTVLAMQESAVLNGSISSLHGLGASSSV